MTHQGYLTNMSKKKVEMDIHKMYVKEYNTENLKILQSCGELFVNYINVFMNIFAV